MHRITCLFILPLVLFSACEQNVGQEKQPRPASTDAVLAHQTHCNDTMQLRIREINAASVECWNNPPPEGCPDTDEPSLIVYGFWNECLDNVPMVPLDCLLQLDHANPLQDTDGDGLTDKEESQMHLNPCEPCSYGGIEGVDCDADLDYDQDGIPNAIDPDPDCTPYHIEMLHCDPLP